jgi:hypothetical protein
MSDNASTPYYQIPGLENVYLEDSYVTAIKEAPRRLEIDLEAVLCEQHPLYRPPAPGEQHSYRTGRLVFADAERIHWIERHPKPFEDASGQIDYGNIDAMCAMGGVYHLEGDWGQVEVASAPPVLVFDDNQS